MKKYYLIFMLLLLVIQIIPIIIATPIKFTSNQSEYYFKLDENAIIPFSIDNFKDPIVGQLSYTITQSTNQNGFAYSSSNTQSQQVTIDKNPFAMNFGTSKTPTTFDLQMTFQYNDGKQDQLITLPKLKIYFVQDDSQKQNKQNEQTSQSQSQEEEQKQVEEQKKQEQKAQEEQQKQIEQQNQLQNRLQNNQMNSDSQSLKNQMQNQIDQQNKLKQKFADNLAKNQDFQKMNQDIMSKGYNMSSYDFNPDNESSGQFNLQYNRPDGESINLSGSMQNNTLKDVKKDSSEEIKQLQKILESNDKYKSYNNDIINSGYIKQDTQINRINDSFATANVTYLDRFNHTSTIEAEFSNMTVSKVKLEKYHQTSTVYLWVLGLLMMITICSVFIYRVYPKNKKSELSVILANPEPAFDYEKESKKLLDHSIELYSHDHKKDAYGKAGESIRLYLSYKHGLKKELTNTTLIKELKRQKLKHEKVQECLNLTTLVEFAKYSANKEDFDKIVDLAKGIINY